MKINLLLMAALLSTTIMGAQQKRKTRFPIGLYTSGNTDIYGLSVGVGSDTYLNSDSVSVRSNGIRLEPISQSLLIVTLIFGPDTVNYPLSPNEYNAFNKKTPNEVINGINLSCGTNAFANLNGITVSALTQSLKNTNGVSLAGLGSQSFKNNGIQIAGAGASSAYSNGLLIALLNTDVYKGNGLQLSMFDNQYVQFSGLQVGMLNDINNKSESFNGLQIGLFNRTKKLKGIQLGLININEKRILPFINWNFKD